jgi:hypothetical protein
MWRGVFVGSSLVMRAAIGSVDWCGVTSTRVSPEYVMRLFATRSAATGGDGQPDEDEGGEPRRSRDRHRTPLASLSA